MDHKYIYENDKLKTIIILNKDYLDMFPDSMFYHIWGSKELFDIQINLFTKDTKDTLYLNLFVFSPRRFYDENNEKYYYDYLSEKEKQYFQGKRFKYLCGLLNYGKSLGLFSNDSKIYTNSTELDYQDSMLYNSIPEKTPQEVTKKFSKLVNYYTKIGFNLLVPINWELEIANRENPDSVPLVSANMFSKVGNIKCKAEL